MYKLIDSGASILVDFNGAKRRLIKHQVHGVYGCPKGMLKIDLGSSLRNVFIRYTDVSLPLSDDLEDLCAILNGMITNCVCCGCTQFDNPT
jgi:hypothetical protein